MISNVLLAGSPSFPTENCELGPLARFNFIFGPNATGKTTISRILETPGHFAGAGYKVTPGSGPVKTFVYNRDYVARTLLEADKLPGVFTLDDEDPKARARLQELRREGGTIAQRDFEHTRLQEELNTVNDSLESLQKDLLEAAWAKRDTMPEELEPMFEGYRGSKAVFFDKLLSVAHDDPADLNDLLREARSAFDTNGTPLTPIERIDEPQWASQPGMSLLELPIVGSKDVSLAELINRLDNHDWVSTGRQYLDAAEHACPFCQQELPNDFLRHLGELFDADYERKIGELRTVADAAAAHAESIRKRLDDVAHIDEDFVDTAERDRILTSLDTVLANNHAAVKEKLSHPSLVVHVNDLEQLVSQANKLIDESNTLVEAHNARLKKHTEAKRTLSERCWTYFVRKVLEGEMATYAAAMSEAQKRRDELTSQVEAAAASLEHARQEARELEINMVSSEPTIERVNRLLKSVGFTNFHVARSTATPDGYSLKRSDGSVVEDTLSDGERTFIAFLYYFAQLESRDLAAESEELVAVIDDPISSLDSDLLFIVSTLVRRLLVTIHTGTGRLKQAVVLTHNLEFYLELTYERELDRQQGLLAGRKYFELRRSADGVNEVRYSETNTIKSTHQRLWDEVRRASAESGPVDKGLETVMRRILEDHFTALGRVPNFGTLADDFSGD